MRSVRRVPVERFLERADFANEPFDLRFLSLADHFAATFGGEEPRVSENTLDQRRRNGGRTGVLQSGDERQRSHPAIPIARRHVAASVDAVQESRLPCSDYGATLVGF